MSRRPTSAIAAIDAANADDPNTIEVRGEVRPKEQAHAELMTEWLDAARPGRRRRPAPGRPGPPPAAVERPAIGLPGRAGRLPALAHRAQEAARRRGRRRSSTRSATTTATIERTQRIIRKEGLGTDPAGADARGRALPRVPRDAARRAGRRPGRREDGRHHPEDRRQDEPRGPLDARRRPPDAGRRPRPDRRALGGRRRA